MKNSIKKQMKTKKQFNYFILALLISILIVPFTYAASLIDGFKELRYVYNFTMNASSIDFITNNVSRMYISKEGLIGINTTTPSHTLTIIGDINVTGVSYLGDTRIYADNVTANNVISRDGNLSFYNDSGDELMRILSTGQVGIGTTEPKSKLEVVGDFNVSGSLANFATSSTGAIGFNAPPSSGDAINSLLMRVNGSGWERALYVESSDIKDNREMVRFRVHDTGHDSNEAILQMHSENPLTNAMMLEITATASNTVIFLVDRDGDVFMGNADTQVGSDGMCWDGHAGSYIGDCTSLRKHKRNITDLNLGLETVLEMRPREFIWVKNMSGQRDIGFIAEEVEEINPLIADYGGDNGTTLSGVKFRHYTAVLTKAIQEQQEQIEELKVDVKKLIEENDLMKKSLCSLGASEWC